MNLSVKNWMVTGLIAMTFIIVVKVLVNKYKVFEPLQAVTNMI